MVVNDLDVVRVTIGPFEADPILEVDADTVLPLPIAPKRFEPIARQQGQIVQLSRRRQ
jgi:hypothetical protein